jgi:hypothetical protein
MQDVANGIAMPNTEILKQALNDHFQNKGDLSKETIESISKMISGSSSKLPYQDFLKRKIKVAENYGFQISQDEINPICKPHQKDIVQWALAGGRRAVFASFGLGKTVMQLEIGYHLNRKTNKPILFGLPLAVRGEFIKDATMLKAGRNGEGYDIRYCRNNDEVQSAVADGVTFIISNYERIRTGSFDLEGTNMLHHSTLCLLGLLKKFQGLRLAILWHGTIKSLGSLPYFSSCSQSFT